MNQLRNLDISMVIVGVIMIIFAKETNVAWAPVLISAFGGLLIGSALAYMSVRSYKKIKKG